MKKPKRLLYLVAGSKGGTGKSMVAAGLCNTYLCRGTTVHLVETDISNPDVISLVGDIAMSPIDRWGEYEGWEVLGQLAADSPAEVIVLNAKAGDVTAFDCFLHDCNRTTLTEPAWEMAKREFADLLSACGRTVVYLHVMRREPVNVQLARDVLPWLPNTVTKVAVLNCYYGKPEDFVHWHNSDTRKLWLAWGGSEIKWPAATDHTMHEVYRLSMAQRLSPATLNSVSAFELMTGKILLDTTKFLPIANRPIMEKCGAPMPLISALYHFQARITATVTELEGHLNTKKAN